jgi:ribosomal protein L13E
MAGAKKTPKKDDTVRFHFDMPGEMFNHLKAKAAELADEAEVPGTEVPLSVVVRRAIWAYVKPVAP